MSRLAVAVALAAVLAGCAGPRPVVERVEATPRGDGRVGVAVTLRNDGRGDGQVSLVVTVRDRANGEVVGRREESVDLRGRERLTVAVEVVTAGGTRGIAAEAEANYPPG